MKIFALSLLAAVVGYFVGALVSYALVTTFSSNTHDLSLEASMTSIFVFGPLVAALAFVSVLAVLLVRRRA